jgi:hypothetical protein
MTDKASFLLALLLFGETDKATQQEDKEKAIKRPPTKRPWNSFLYLEEVLWMRLFLSRASPPRLQENISFFISRLLDSLLTISIRPVTKL